jgi:hypothetical protein
MGTRGKQVALAILRAVRGEAVELPEAAPLAR